MPTSDAAREMLEQLQPYDVGLAKVRVGSDADGGYILANLGLDRPGRVAYSYGVWDNADWDHEMADRYGFTVHAYDPSIEEMPRRHPGLIFHREGVDHLTGKSSDTLANQLAKNGHDNRDDLILKMDIEGYEWRVLLTAKPSVLRHFEQMVFEFHGLAVAKAQALYTEIFRSLNSDFYIHHVHANNYGPVAACGELSVPTTLEISYVRKDRVAGAVPSRAHFPTDLDRPNNSAKPDIVLDFFPFAPRS